MKLTFYGAAREVTGSCFFIEANGKKILIIFLLALALRVVCIATLTTLTFGGTVGTNSVGGWRSGRGFGCKTPGFRKALPSMSGGLPAFRFFVSGLQNFRA